MNQFSRPSGLRMGARRLVRALGRSPIQSLLRNLRLHDMDLGSLDALEVYGGTGEWQAYYYLPAVKSLTVWEINRDWLPALKYFLPNANIKLTDSYEEVRATDQRFDLVLLDNPTHSRFGPEGRYTEHFEMFPHIFRLLSARSALVLDVVPSLVDAAAKASDLEDEPVRRERRAAFYETSTPEDIRLEEIAGAYRTKAEQAGMEVLGHYFQQRHYVWYLMLCLSR